MFNEIYSRSFSFAYIVVINMVMAMFYYCVENQSINVLNIGMPLMITNFFMNKKLKSLVVLLIILNENIYTI